MTLGQVGHQQALIAQNLRGGLAGLGDRKLEEAQFGLDKAQLEHQMGRERAGDERQAAIDAQTAPIREVQSQTAQNQLDEANAPVRLTDFMTDMNTTEHMLWTPQDASMGKGAPEGVKDPAITKIASMYGATWDTNPQSPTRGQMLRADGTPITKLDLHRDSGPLKAFMVANSGMDHTMRSADEKLLRAFQTGKITKIQYDEGQAKLVKFKSSLPGQMQYAQKQVDMLSQFTNSGNTLFNSEITQGLKRWQGKYDGLSKKLEKQREKLAERAFEFDKLDITEGGKNRRHNEKMVLEIEKLFSKEEIDRAKAEKGGKSRTYADRLNEQKLKAYTAYLDGTATPEQIRIFGLDKDVYLAQAAKMVNDEQTVLFEDERLSPEETTDRIITLANRMRQAALPNSEGNDPLNIR